MNKLIVLAVLATGLGSRALAQEQFTDLASEAVGTRTPIADLSAPVDRTFYTGALNYYWQPASGASLAGSGYGTTANGGTISSVTACFYNLSSASRSFTADLSVGQGVTTLQTIPFTSSFTSHQVVCHQVTGFNAVLQPGEFRVSVSFDQLDADNIYAGLSATASGQVFDVEIAGQRPPSTNGVQMKGIGIGYRIAENDPPPTLCVPDADTLCLNGGRFKVEATYQTSSASGTAKVVKLTDQTGYLWFFNQENVEAVVKVLDACGINNRYWVFAAGLTNQGVGITVTDTLHPALVKHYANALNRTFVTVTDTEGLASCP